MDGVGLSNRVALLNCFGPRPMGRPSDQLLFYYLKSAQNCEFESGDFPRSKFFQTLYEDTFGYDEHLSQLGRLQIPNRIQVINFGTNSNLNPPRILKGFKPRGKKLVNSLKFYLDLIFPTVNLVGHICMQEIRVPIQVSNDLIQNKGNEFEFEIQTKPY
jgi:hypothetical protein